jgi:hypothetical protein
MGGNDFRVINIKMAKEMDYRSQKSTVGAATS